MPNDFVILETADAFWPWTFADSEAHAAEKIAALVAEDATRWSGATVMTYDAYAAAHDARYLDEPVLTVTESDFDYALGELPPLQWHTTPEGVNVFCCSEFTSGRITRQYGRYRGAYRTRNVAYGDRSTYLRPADFA